MNKIIEFFKQLFSNLFSGKMALAEPKAPESQTKEVESKKVETELVKEPIWYAVAKAEMGVHEIPGEKNNPRILQYHKATKLKATDDETAWCSAFACWCMQQAGIKSTENAMARSWMNWGVEIKQPRLGCVVVFWRGTKSSSEGHVAFFVKKDSNFIYVLGGNQSDQVCIKPYNINQLLGYRWPKEEKI